MWKVFLTGATGFLGGELAVALSKLDSVEKITCLVRAKDDCEAVDRLVELEGVLAVIGVGDERRRRAGGPRARRRRL